MDSRNRCNNMGDYERTASSLKDLQDYLHSKVDLERLLAEQVASNFQDYLHGWNIYAGR